MHVDNTIYMNEYFTVTLGFICQISDKEHKYSNHSLGKNMMLCMPAKRYFDAEVVFDFLAENSR